MDVKQRVKAIQNLLGYCRGRPLLTLGVGRALAPALLRQEWQGPLDDEELRKAMTELLQENLIRCRQLADINQPISIDDIEHGKALSEDIKGSAELRVWSVLWAYYVCAMSHERMQDICGWSKRVNQLTLAIGRRKYIEPIIVERERALQTGHVNPEKEDGGEPASLIETDLRQALPLELHMHTQQRGAVMASTPHVDVLLLTVTDAETVAVLSVFESEVGQAAAVHHLGGKVYYQMGRVGGAEVWLTRTEMGVSATGGALLATSQAITTVKPTAVVMVGIAFGINAKKQQIGDVLVSKQLMLYNLQRIGTGLQGQLVISPRGERPAASVRLLERFRNASVRWRISPPVGDSSPPEIHMGLVLSGDALVDNLDFRSQLLRFEAEAIGGDMEGAGLYLAAHDAGVDWILVKAICDWGDGNKGRNKQQRQQIAARNAATFTLHTLKQGGFGRTTSPAPPVSEQPVRRGGKLPPPPKLVVGREDDLQALKARLDTSSATANIQVLTAMRGWPGVGKTTLAAAAAYDPEIAAMFPDGVLWASLGQNTSIDAELGAWCRALGLLNPGTARSTEELSAQLRLSLHDRRFLIIVDDVWRASDVEPFRVGGSGCAMLITTRLTEVAREVVPTASNVFVLEVLTLEKALELLRLLAPKVVEEHPEACRELVADLERLPLAIQVAGRMLQARRSLGLSVVTLLADIREGAKLIEAKPPADRPEVAQDTSATVAALLQKSTDLLNPLERECFARLGVFSPKPATFAQAAMRHMWQLEDATPMIARLVDYGLLEPQQTGRFWLHALLKVHARTLIED